MNKWYEINNPQGVISPALLIYPDRIQKNIEMMIKIAGGTAFLRPHIKTHKIAEIIQLQLNYGIAKFKCATIAEAELLAKCGAVDILLAMQPVGVNIVRFFELIQQYPNSKFSTIVDNSHSINEISEFAFTKGIAIPIWLDINNGMNRTGIQPTTKAVELYKKIVENPNLIAKGLHVYDGHIHESDFKLRKEICDKYFEPVLKLKDDLEKIGIRIETIVAGGTPTFPIHIKRKDVETSPGTPLLWDQGYTNLYPDLKFLPAAVLIARVISKPMANLICFDLGHKSVASEMKLPRVQFLNEDNFKQISQSEEHLVVECNESAKYTVGDVLYAIPIHICPTVIKYKSVLTVIQNEVKGSWQVAARDYQ
jgi:D-serine deaminase-like pyridoxal phosphate-dependent protein